MADSDKKILITPATGTASQPTIQFVGGANNPVNLNVLDDGTLSFTGSAGQLFSVSDNLSGTIFSVNDVSGIPSIEVDDDGTVTLAEFSGNVLIGTGLDDGQNKLQVQGTVTCTSVVETSSITLKENVNPITDALNAILQLEGVTYDRKDGSSKGEAGLIAEDVYQVLPHLVQLNEDGQPAGITYTKLSVYLIEAIKALQSEIETLKGNR